MPGYLAKTFQAGQLLQNIMILMVYILTLIGTIALIFFSVDWTIELYKWQSRIHIGRWTDRKAWQQAVVKKRHANGYTKALPYRLRIKIG